MATITKKLNFNGIAERFEDGIKSVMEQVEEMQSQFEDEE